MEGTDRSWTLLHVEDDAAHARSIVTSIAAMEFDVRLVHAATGREVSPDAEPETWSDAGWRVEVRIEDWPDLHDVLDEIIGEQREFDQHLVRRGRQALIANWVVLGGTALAAAAVLLLVRLRSG